MNKEMLQAIIERKIDRQFLNIIEVSKPVFIRTPDNEKFTTSTKESIYTFTQDQIISLANCINEDSYVVIDIGYED